MLARDAKFCTACGTPAEESESPVRISQADPTDELSSFEFGDGVAGPANPAPPREPRAGAAPAPRVVWRTPEPSDPRVPLARPDPGARTAPYEAEVPGRPGVPPAGDIARERPAERPARREAVQPPSGDTSEPPAVRRWILAPAVSLVVVAALAGGFWMVFRAVRDRDEVGGVAAPSPAPPVVEASVPAPAATEAPETPRTPRFSPPRHLVAGATPVPGRRALLAFDTTGRWLAGLHPPGEELGIWDLVGARRPVRFGVPAGTPSALAVSPDGRLLALATRGPSPSVTLWDVETGAAALAVSFPGDPEAVAFRSGGLVLVLSGIAVFELSPVAGRVRELSRPEGFVPIDPREEAAVFSPDGSRLARMGAGLVSLWELPGGRLVSSRATEPGGPRPSLVFRRDGQYLAAGEGRTVVVRDAATLSRQRSLEGHAGAVTGVAWSDDGRYLVSAGGEVRLWDVVAARHLDTLPAGDDSSVAIAPGGSTVAVADGGDLRLVDLR